MLLGLFCVLIIVSLLFPRSKILFAIDLFFLWFLSAYCIQKADVTIYQIRYYNYEMLSSQMEVGFTLLMSLFNKLGIDYYLFLKIIYAVIIIFIGRIVYLISDKYTAVIALYAVFSYCIDMIQLRNTMGFLLAIFGIYYLTKEDKRSNLKFILCILGATLFHLSMLFYLLLFIPKYFSTRKTILLSILILIFGSIFINKNVLYGIATLFISKDRVTTILNRLNDFTGDTALNIRIAMIIFFASSVLVLAVAYGKSLKNTSENPELKKKNNFILFVIKSNIIIMSVFVLLPFSLDFYRLQRYFILFNYIGYMNPIVLDKNNYKASDMLYILVGLIYCLINFYIQIVKLGNYNMTFMPLFNYNTFIM